MLRRRSKPKAEELQEIRGFDDFELRLGDVMRGERATLGKSLLDVQRDLKIKASYVAAIENADASAFETPGFIAGYVRSYARYLGLDPEWAYARFREESGTRMSVSDRPGEALHMTPAAIRAGGPRAKATTAIGMGARSRDALAHPHTPFVPGAEAVFSRLEPAALGSSAVLLLLIVGLGYGAWSVLQQIQKVQISPIDQTPGVVASLDPLAAATGQGGTRADKGVAGLGGQGQDQPGNGAAFERLYRPAALDAPVLSARDAPISTLDPNMNGVLAPDENTRLYARTQNPPPPDAAAAGSDQLAGAATGVAISGSAPAARSPGTSGVQVVAAAAPAVALVAVRPSWVRVTAADGTVIFQKILNAGEHYTLPQSARPPRLRAGNSGSLYFAVNGRTYGPAGRGTSVAKNVILSAAAITRAYKLADTTADPALAKATAVADASPGH